LKPKLVEENSESKTVKIVKQFDQTELVINCGDADQKEENSFNAGL
jgi:hypothetical protein